MNTKATLFAGVVLCIARVSEPHALHRADLARVQEQHAFTIELFLI